MRGARFNVQCRHSCRHSLVVLALVAFFAGGSIAADVQVGWRAPHAGRSIETLDLEAYTARALNGEAGVFTSRAALEAMAITIRTFAQANRGRHRVDGYDFCDTTHCQRLLRDAPPAPVRAAVERTHSMILWAKGRPAEVFFHRNCGGQTEDAGALWPGASRAWLPVQADEACARISRREWRASVPLADLARALGVRDIHALRVGVYTRSGRVARLTSDAGPFTGDQLHLAVGRTLGWGQLKSGLYTLHVEPGAGGAPVAVFDGHGSGHGVGLCQDGAEARGRAGESAGQILAFYFPGTKSGVQAQDLHWQELRGERVTLRAERPGGAVLAHCERALRSAEQLCGLEARAPVRVDLYPSLDTYRDSTGEPGFVLASTRGDVVRLQPAARFGAPASLQAALTHEMLHVLIAQRARQPLPRWFGEGLVLVLAGASGPRQPWSFASERLVSAPRNEAEVRAGYAAAAAGVRDLIARHGRETVLSWVERGLPAEFR